jgi:hypothetical protein
MRIIFGVRTALVKKYPISYFNISKEEAENIKTQYTDLDIYNSLKDKPIDPPRVEKRVSYFHLYFLPVFPTSTHWTVRNKYGLFKANLHIKKKIKNKIPKVYPPWYSFLLPLLIIIGTALYFSNNYIKQYKYTYQQNNKIKHHREQLISELDTCVPPYFLSFNYSKYYSYPYFERVDSIKNNVFYISRLPDEVIKKIKKGQKIGVDYKNYQAFVTQTNLLEKDSISKNDLLLLIRKNIGDRHLYNGQIKQLNEIIRLDVFTNPMPNLKVSTSGMGLWIVNKGKPLVLHSFKSNEENLWQIKNASNFNFSRTIQVIPKTLDLKPKQVFYFVFLDNDGNMFKYTVMADYQKDHVILTDLKTEIEKVDF